MARQQASSQRLKPIMGVALAGLGLVILFGKLNGPAALLTSLLGPATKEALGLLRFLVPAVWQALQAYAFDYQRFSPCPLQMLVSFWPLLHFIAGAF